MSGKKRILIVDDEEDFCFILSKNFKMLGDFDVSYALTGQQALSQIRSFAPDLVFLDLGLKDIDGISLIKRIHALNSSLQVIILTGRGTHDSVEMAFKAGAVDFALKPCETKKLIELVKKHIPEGLEKQELKLPKTARFTKLIFLDILASFVSASEAKSKYLKGHSERVADLSKKIGQKLGFNKDQLEVLEYSAIMHDVGKIGVKDEILDKEGKLALEEWEQIKKHPVIGSEIINKIRLLRLEAPNIEHHHERFDGAGYPDGLKEKDIPLMARIIAVADTFDAITSKRPYRNQNTIEDAALEIKKNSGSQFDPQIVEAFLKIIQ